MYLLAREIKNENLWYMCWKMHKDHLLINLNLCYGFIVMLLTLKEIESFLFSNKIKWKKTKVIQKK